MPITRPCHPVAITLAFSCLLPAVTLAGDAESVSRAELRARREAVLARLTNQVFLVPARPGLADVAGQGFRQRADFLYLTGLADEVGSVLVLDGTSRTAVLFQPATPGPFADAVGLKAASAASLVERSGLERVAAWDDLLPFLRERTKPGVTLRVARAGFDAILGAPVAMPSGLGATGGDPWRAALAGVFPGVEIVDDALLAEMRLVKSAGEIALLRRAGAASAAAFQAGLRTVGPGRRQREVEGAVVSACLREADGVSFWPWAMSGPLAVFPAPWDSLRDPRHLDRTMAGDDLVRLDVGCAASGYMGDVGRTVPVARKFLEPQSEAWDLLVAAYRAGLSAIRDGVTVQEVMAASGREVARAQGSLRTDLARHVAAAILRPDGAPHWQIHGVGLDVAEGPSAPTDVLRAGMVIDYEPIVAVDGVGLYIEDMLLVTATGHEVLTPGLPYLAREIEAAMVANPVL